ncbi:MAG: hypothetical protein SGILL_005459 [Bacillariaceae sp.]
MPLGLLAKDSMVNLTELASNKEEANELEETRSSLSKSGASPGDDVMVQVLPAAGRRNGVKDSKKIAPPAEEQPENGDGGSGDSSAPETGALPSMKVTTIDDSGAGTAAAVDKHDVSQTQSENDSEVNNISSRTSAEHDKESVQSGDSKALTANTNTTAALSTPSKEDVMSNGSVAESSYAASDAKMAAAKAVGQYSGFSADYHDFESYASYAPATSGQLVATHFDTSYREEVPFWCCFFPWITGAKLIEDDSTLGQDDNSDQGGETTALIHDMSAQDNLSRTSSNADDEISTGSGIYGEKLSEKEKQAVIARLKLAEPDSTAEPQQPTNENTSPVEKPRTDEPKAQRRKSILKRSSTTVTSSNKDLNSLTKSSGRSNVEQNGTKARRSLFPSYETKAPSERHNMNTHFAPMARVVTIKSLKEMSEQEKSQVWWQKPDYEEFRRTGRMITRAMLEGGSEVWLATNQSWQMPNQGKAKTLQNATTLANRHAAFKNGDVKAKMDYEDTRDKWWHKFGHSRRGLEHIASIDEGRQRQANVKASVRSVLEEQRRQRVFHREDPEKLRMVSIQNTTWAKDLAMASGASDADCIQKNFDDDNRRTREFYLLKFSRANPSANLPSSSKKAMPAFMKPMMTMQMPSNRFDANTTSQIRYRAQKKPAARPVTHKRGSSAVPEKATQVPIRDGDDAYGDSMAKKAAGFASGEEIGNMSAVLSGMGGMGTIATVGGP